MTRISPTPAKPGSEQEALFRQCRERLGFVPMTLRVMARKPELLTAWFALIKEVYLKPSEVPTPLKRLIAHAISRVAECPYSMAHTAEAAAQAGVPLEKIKAVFECETDPQFSGAERAALAVARSAGAIPNAVNDDHFELLRAHFSDDQILEIVAVISLFGFLNRWQSTLALTLEEEPRAFAEQNITEIGWALGRHGGDDVEPH